MKRSDLKQFLATNVQRRHVILVACFTAVMALDFFWYKPMVAAEEQAEQQRNERCVEAARVAIYDDKNLMDEYRQGGLMEGCEGARIPPYG